MVKNWDAYSVSTDRLDIRAKLSGYTLTADVLALERLLYEIKENHRYI